jgi:3-deoxy-D-manno-octulosonic-acid transferase
MIVLYNAALLLSIVLTAPWILWQYLYKRKYRGSLLSRVGFDIQKIPNPKERRTIWIHAVSLGEMKSSLPLIQKCRTEWPSMDIYFSTTTETSYNEVKKILGNNVDHLFYLPLDFSWIVSKYVQKLKPELFILIETDFWPNLLREVRRWGGTVVVASGKISEISFHRLKKWSIFSDWIFQKIDLICCQSQIYRERFLGLGIPNNHVFVTGNLKYDITPAPKFLLQNLDLPRIFITLASTHEGEESGLLRELADLPSEVCFLIAPRHPERFSKVEKFLDQQGILFDKFTEIKGGLRKAAKRVVLINTIGELDKCYALSKLVIVGGSFVPGIGGHNIYEPIRFYKSVLFGPFMENQQELVKDVIFHCAARQTNLTEIKRTTLELLANPIEQRVLKDFEEKMKGAATRTFEKIQETLARKHSLC